MYDTDGNIVCLRLKTRIGETVSGYEYDLSGNRLENAVKYTLMMHSISRQRSIPQMDRF